VMTVVSWQNVQYRDDSSKLAECSVPWWQ